MTIDSKQQRLDDIAKRLSMASSGPWRNTIRREDANQVAAAIRNVKQRPGARCSEVVVNTDHKPDVSKVICWMGPAAGEKGDDRLDAEFMAHAREDIEWLLELVRQQSSANS